MALLNGVNFKTIITPLSIEWCYLILLKKYDIINYKMIKKREKIMKFIRIDGTKLINIEEIQDVYSHLGDVYIDFKSGNSPMRIICGTYTDRDAVIQGIQKAIEACNGSVIVI